MDFSYVCTECGAEYDILPELTQCPECRKNQSSDEPLRGVLEVKYLGTPISASFEDMCPVSKEFFPPLPVGNTPLWSPVRLRKASETPNLYIKDDGLNPTFSFKDRASFLVSAFAASCGINEITLASTGNAGSSMAGVGAAAGQKITLFLPEKAPVAKIAQALQYGAKVFKVRGVYDKAYDLSIEYSKITGGMNRNTAYNPMTIEGKKSVSFEIAQQLGKAPDFVFVSVGDGCIISGVYKGFRDLFQFGMIDKIPVIYGVQSEGSDAIYRAWNNGGKFEPISAQTIADSISVDVPRNGYHAIRQLQNHDGRVIKVSDDQIIKAQTHLSATTGLFGEPAGAAAFAGFLSVKNEIPSESTVVIINTGSGLKDVKGALLGTTMPEESINTVDEAIKMTQQ